MSIDEKTVHKIGRLARIHLENQEVGRMQENLTTILKWIDQLNEVSTEGIPPMFSVNLEQMPLRPDQVTEGGNAEDILANAPESAHHMFAVPKVI